MKSETYLPKFFDIEADVCNAANATAAAHDYLNSFLSMVAEHSVGFKRQAEVASYLLSTAYTSTEYARLRYYAVFEGDRIRARGTKKTKTKAGAVQ